MNVSSLLSIRCSSRRRRSKVAAWGIGLVVLGASSAPARSHKVADSNRNANKPYNSQFITPVIDQKIYPKPCNGPQTRNDEEICLETRNADAEEQQVFWDKLTFGVGIGGTLAVVASTIFAAIAAASAQRSAIAAEAAIKSSDALLDHARKATEIELRAYLVVSETKVREYSSSIIHVNIRIENTGKTPAYNVSVASDCQIAHVSGADIRCINSAATNKSPKIIVGAGNSITDVGRIAIPNPVEPWNAGLNSGQLMPFYFGLIEYEDAFGNKHTTRYCLAGPASPTDTGVTPHSSGNEVT